MGHVRIALAVVALSALVAACAADEDPSLSGPGGPSVSVDGSTPTGVQPAPRDDQDGAADPAPGPPETVAPESGPELGPVGSWAAVVLRPQPVEELILQVASQPGAEPRQSTIDALVSVLREVSGKPVATSGGSVAEGREVWSGAQVRSTADSLPASNGGRVVTLRFLFLGGRYEDEAALGVAVRGDVAAVFPERVDDAAGPLLDASSVEEAVAMHELGHLLGLVDLAIDTGRDDPEHPGHSSNRGSVMYWAVETDLVSQILSGGPPTRFDDADRADLARIRAG